MVRSLRKDLKTFVERDNSSTEDISLTSTFANRRRGRGLDIEDL